MAFSTARFALHLTLAAAISVGAAACRDRVSTCNPNIDYFPSKPTFEDASTISKLDFENTFVDFCIRDPFLENRKFRFIRCGCEEVAGTTPDDVTRISVPPKGLYVGDSVVMAMLTTAVEGKRFVKAVSSPGSFYSEAVRKSLDTGEIKGFEHGEEIGKLAEMSDEIDVSIVNSFSAGMYTNASREYGLKTPFLLSAESAEETPLGRAEWIKLFGLLIGAVDKAERTYEDIKMRYEGVRKDALSIRRRPSVMVNLPFAADIPWWVAGGQTYSNALLRDAKVDYRFGTTGKRTHRSLTLREVEESFGSAKFWIHADRFAVQDDSLEKMFVDSSFPREVKAVMKNLASVKCGNVWSRSKRVNGAGANDYFELGVVRPDKVLEDLVAIFHPKFSKKDHRDLTFYHNLGKAGSVVKDDCPYNELPADAPGGKTFYEAVVSIDGVGRFAVEDLLAEGRLARGIAEVFDGVGVKDVEIFFEDAGSGTKQGAIVSVRLQVDIGASVDGMKVVSVFEKEFPGANARVVSERTRNSFNIVSASESGLEGQLGQVQVVK